MRLWRVVLLLNLAIGLGLLAGYLAWGRQLPRLAREAEQSRQQAAIPAVEQTFNARGVVRAVFPEANLVIITHGDIPGYMPAMTMGFQVTEARLYDGLDVGDVIQFTLRGIPPTLLITALTRDGKT